MESPRGTCSGQGLLSGRGRGGVGVAWTLAPPLSPQPHMKRPVCAEWQWFMCNFKKLGSPRRKDYWTSEADSDSEALQLFHRVSQELL